MVFAQGTYHFWNSISLCLRYSSGEILSRQMAAMRCHVFANFEYITAPFPATGDPDRGIQQYYPDKDYYEWYSFHIKSYDTHTSLQTRYTLDKGDDRNWQISQSVDRVMSEVAMNGPFDGILGFSQVITEYIIGLFNDYYVFKGCAMAMRVLLQLQREQLRPFKFAVFLGGVTPDGSEQGVSHKPTLTNI